MTNNDMVYPSTLKRRSDLHLARKIWHIVTVFAMFLGWVLFPKWLSITILLVAMVAFLSVDFIRQYHKGLNDWMIHAFRVIMRESEVNKLAGTTYLLTGVAIVVFIFPRPVTSMTLLFLAFADPIASYVGIRWGKDKIINNKSFQGTMAAYVVCALASFIYLAYWGQPLGRSVVFALIAGAVGALAELLPFGKIDDNFTLPVASAVGLNILFYFFGFS